MKEPAGPELQRRLGTFDTVTIGLGSMIGAGIFVALPPAAAAAGTGLLISLAIAAFVAFCNAMSTARLAARYPQSGGAYVYGRERLGAFWGHAAGWSFVVGKTASCAAMALTVGYYVWPAHAAAIAVASVVALTAFGYTGIQKSALLTRIIVAVVLAVLALVVVIVLGFGDVERSRLVVADVSGTGILSAAGLLFFAFAGYARIATLGEEVRDPAKTIPRAVPVALGITLVVYALVATATLAQLGSARLASTDAPLAEAVREAGFAMLVPVVGAGAAIGALGALLALLLGVSRTALAMARDGHLPRALAAVHPRHRTPHRAELAVGIIVALLAAVVDVRGAIGFSSFAVLLYYAIANASALTLGSGRLLPAIGLASCLLLALTLPATAVIAGTAVVLIGMAGYGVQRTRRARG
ncbi:MAG: APC family permease [Mycolicibacterium sp.]|uniref:APC family permease n=1 Tax=Mycolicibacterium sp. TaxID=2320850 RepID=UPI003D0B897C